MLRRAIVWLCLADGEHAKILTPIEEGRGYALVTQFDSADAHRPTHALGTDRPPRTQEGASTGRHVRSSRAKDLLKTPRAKLPADLVAEAAR